MLKYAAKEFCSKTCLHGFSFLVLPNRYFLERIIWLILICAAMSTVITLLLFSHTTYTQYGVKTVSDFTNYPIWNYRFPAVTICNFNQISKQKLMERIKNWKFSSEIKYNYFRHLLNIISKHVSTQDSIGWLENVLVQNDMHSWDLYEQITPSCNDMLQKCRWKGEAIRCGMLFEQIQTRFGFCCTFNSYSIKNHTFSGLRANKMPENPRKTSSCSSKAGLEVVLHNLPTDYFATNIASFGHKILVHYPYDFPDGNEYTMLLGLHTVMSLAVSPSIVTTAKDVQDLDIKTRNCLFSHEKEMHTFQHYTFNNCMTECRIIFIINHCGCIPFFYYNKHGDLRDYRICSFRDIPCIQRFVGQILSSIPGINYNTQFKSNSFSCFCLPNCEYSKYQIESSSTEISNLHAFGERSLYSGINLQNNTSILKVFFNNVVGKRNTIVVNNKWYYTFAFLGGLIALFTGFNFGIGFELFYHFLISPIVKKIQVIRNKKTRININHFQ